MDTTHQLETALTLPLGVLRKSQRRQQQHSSVLPACRLATTCPATGATNGQCDGARGWLFPASWLYSNSGEPPGRHPVAPGPSALACARPACRRSWRSTCWMRRSRRGSPGRLVSNVKRSTTIVLLSSRPEARQNPYQRFRPRQLGTIHSRTSHRWGWGGGDRRTRPARLTISMWRPSAHPGCDAAQQTPFFLRRLDTFVDGGHLFAFAAVFLA